MAKKIRFQDVFQPGDILAIIIIIVGVLIAIFLDGIAVKLIGVSIAVLGGLALILMISQRLSEIVESNKFNIPETKNIKMTVVKDATAKRQTVENFDPSIDIEKVSAEQTMGADEGFRIVSKTSRSLQKNDNQPSIQQKEEAQVETTILHEQDNEKIENQVIDTTNIESPEIVDKVIESENKITSEKENIYQETEKLEKEEEILEIQAKTTSEDVSEKLKDEYKSSNAEIESRETIIEVIDNEKEAEEETLIEKNEEKIEISQDDKPYETRVIDKIEENKEQIEDTLPQNRDIEIQQKSDFKKHQVELPPSLFDDDLSAVDEPRKEFDTLLSRILYVIPLVIKSRTTAFTFINMDKNYLILESYVTNIPGQIVEDTKIPMGNDIISQIYENAKPEILTEINPSAELDLIPYYKEKTGTSSFVGIPVFYNNEVVGILSCDTNENDAYDASTITFLGQFSKLISGLIKNYTEKYELIRTDKALKAINKFAEISSKAESSIETVSKALFETITDIYDTYSFGICLYDEKREGFYIFDYTTKYDFPVSFKNEAIDLGRTLLGQTILNYKTIVEIPVQSNLSRVSIKEYPFAKSYFIAVPIKTETTVYGALFFDGPVNEADNFDIELLETLAREAAHTIDRFKLIQLFHTSAIIDPHTGLMNNYAFFRRLQEEVARVRDYKSLVSFCLIAIDKYAAYSNEEDSNKFEQIFHHIVSILNRSIHEYDVIGRLDTSIIGVILIGQSVDKAKFWAENIRNKAAISVLEIDGRRFTVTLSIGIAQISPVDDLDTLLENCNKVLNIAASKTNCVQVYH